MIGDAKPAIASHNLTIDTHLDRMHLSIEALEGHLNIAPCQYIGQFQVIAFPIVGCITRYQEVPIPVIALWICSHHCCREIIQFLVLNMHKPIGSFTQGSNRLLQHGNAGSTFELVDILLGIQAVDSFHIGVIASTTSNRPPGYDLPIVGELSGTASKQLLHRQACHLLQLDHIHKHQTILLNGEAGLQFVTAV